MEVVGIVIAAAGCVLVSTVRFDESAVTRLAPGRRR
jgi:hypothetical protein